MITSTTLAVISMKLDLESMSQRLLGSSDQSGVERVMDLSFKKTGLKDKLASTPGKMGIADGGYEMGEEKDMGLLCLPNTMDSRELKHFKSWACCCHESLNGRLNNFKILQDKF
jgi:hypothetical protein